MYFINKCNFGQQQKSTSWRLPRPLLTWGQQGRWWPLQYTTMMKRWQSLYCREAELETCRHWQVWERAKVDSETGHCPVWSVGWCVAAWSLLRHDSAAQHIAQQYAHPGSGQARRQRWGMLHLLDWTASKDHPGDLWRDWGPCTDQGSWCSVGGGEE